MNKLTKKISLIAFLIVLSITTKAQLGRTDRLMQILRDPSDRHVLVAAHRGDWRNAPENSLEAIQLCINMGVDIAEIDVQLTKDGHLVLMHDKSVDRMTSAKGSIKDYTLSQLQSLTLKNAYGTATRFKIPTLREALQLAKGKIILFIDKGYEHIPLIIEELNSTGTTKQVLLEGKQTLQETVARYPEVQKLDIVYMPRISTNEQADQIISSTEKPAALILSFEKEKGSVLEQLSRSKKNKSRLMVTTLWPETCAGHDDDLALSDPDGTWGWAINKGAGIICTDRPGMLVDYLKKKNLHP